jgi:translation initiation factor 5A
MVDVDEEFDKVDTNGSDTYPATAGDIKKNGYMVISGRPCKVVDYSTAKTGKHGHARASITAIDIFNGRKLEDSLPTSHGVDVPNIKRIEMQAISLDEDGYVTLMNDKGETRADLSLPTDTENDEEVAKKIKEGVEQGLEVLVTILQAMGIEKIVECKFVN